MRAVTKTEYVGPARLVELLQSSTRDIRGITQISEATAIVRHADVDAEAESPPFTNPLIGELQQQW